jgi:very-short-patch-repair endonuclease
MRSKKTTKIIVARQFRKDPTFAEGFLWQKLRNRKFNGIKFRRQYIIKGFVLDFYCPDHKLGIELDGSIHNKQVDHDKARQNFIETHGINIIRFKNDDVIKNIDRVLLKINNNICAVSDIIKK